jgi:predicted membrane chloride channel (bestrophin family)
VHTITGHRKSEQAILWREEVVFRAISLLQMTMKVLKYRYEMENCWEGESDDVLVDLKKYFDQHPVKRDLDARIPFILAHHLRKVILDQRTGAFKEANLHVAEELKILSFIDQYVVAWASLNKLQTTPFPFPLVQMGRTFLFFWIFSLPFVIVKDKMNPTWLMVLMFFITYGFAGLEYVSIELDDPFGNDPNDFDDENMSKIVVDDMLSLVFKSDGPQSEENLKVRAGLANEIPLMNRKGL